MRSAFLSIPLLMALAPSAQATEPGMTSLSESELSAVSGQEGVLLNLNFRNNVDASNTPIGCTPLVGTPNPCRLGLEFAARTGKWLMLKEYYGTFQIKDLRMDAGFLPAANTAYWNQARFDGTGNVLCTTPLIPACNPKDRPVVKFAFPGTDAPSTYDDFLSFLNIGRTWLEFDSGATPGFMRDTTLNSALGVRMSDSTSLNAPARMRFRGTGYVYGF